MSSRPMNVTLPERMTFSLGSRFITERAKIVLPDPDSPTTPSVLPRFRVIVDAVDGAHPATRGQEVRLEVLDLQQRLGLGLFYGPRRWRLLGSCGARRLVHRCAPRHSHGRHLNERSVSVRKSNAAPIPHRRPPRSMPRGEQCCRERASSGGSRVPISDVDRVGRSVGAARSRSPRNSSAVGRAELEVLVGRRGEDVGHVGRQRLVQRHVATAAARTRTSGARAAGGRSPAPAACRRASAGSPRSSARRPGRASARPRCSPAACARCGACSSAPKRRMSSSSRRAWLAPAHRPVRANKRSWW